jgi:hypothetical protein
MNERRLSDADLAAGLRAVMPGAAPVGSADRLSLALRSTRQERPVRMPFAPLFDADPAGRRWAVLVAAALLLAAVATAAGALRLWLTTPRPDLSLDPPSDLQAYMVSVAQDSPIVRPMAFTVVRNEPVEDAGEIRDQRIFQRVYLDASGTVRIEQYASAEASEPATYAITASDRHFELASQGSELVWIEEVRPWDPLDWVFVTTAAYTGVADRGCEMLEPDPSAGWEYVGLEEVLGRPVHHVRCDGDFWVDVETRLVLRSQSSDVPARTAEVTSLEFGPQPAALFDTTRPDGLRTVTREEQGAYEDRQRAAADCAADPICAAPTVPIVTPPPASAAPSTEDVATLMARARAAREAAPPLHLTVTRWRSKGGDAGLQHLDYVRADRFRVEWGSDPVAGTPARTTIAVSVTEGYESHSADDGDVTWRHLSGPSRSFLPAYWLDDTLIALPDECPGGSRYLGVDAVIAFTADHIECDRTEYWIDRATGLVVRRQTPADEMHGIEVVEVVDLAFGPTPDELLRLPEGAALEPEPTPDPNFVPTAAPQPSAGG